MIKKTLYKAQGLKIIAMLILLYPIIFSIVSATQVSYWKFDETSGAGVNDSLGRYNATAINTPLIINGYDGKARAFNGINQWVNVSQTMTQLNGISAATVEAWVNINRSTGIENIFAQDSSGGNRHFHIRMNTGKVEFGVYTGGGNSYDVQTTSNIPLNQWVHIAGVYNGTGLALFINGNFNNSASASGNLDTVTTYATIAAVDGGTGQYLNGSIDELMIWNETRTQAQIQDDMGAIFLTVNLGYPADSYSSSSSNIEFYGWANITGLARLNNLTLYIWNSNSSIFNKTTFSASGIGSSLNTTIYNIPIGSNYKWNILADGNYTSTTLSWATNRTLDVSAEIIAESYQSAVYETSSQSFEVNITAPTGATLHSALFNYNGTNYTASTSLISSSTYRVFKKIDIPQISQNTTKNFFWNFAYTNLDNSITRQITSSRNQNVSLIVFTKCNASYSNMTLNFTIKDEKNPNPVITASFYSAWDYWLGGGSERKTYSFEDTNENLSSFNFCLFPSFHTFYVDVDIEYEKNYYEKGSYYLVNASLNNVTQNIALYLINSSIATLTTLAVQDQYQNEMPGVVIQIQKYDVGTDTYYTVTMAKTSSLGSDISYLNWYNTFYKFILIRNNTILQITDPMKVSSTPLTFTITPETIFRYDKFKDVSWTLYFNNATNNFVLTFIDTAGKISSGCLEVKRYSGNIRTTICNTCESSSSATLYCSINQNLTGEYTATFYATGSNPRIFGTISKKIKEAVTDIYSQLGNKDGAILTFIMAGVVSSLFFFSPPLAIIGILAGLLIAIGLGFTQISIGTFVGLSLIGGFLIWLIKN